MNEKEMTIEEIFSEGETIIENININGMTIDLQRALIQCKKRMIIMICQLSKELKDKRYFQKLGESVKIESLIEGGMKKTPAQDQIAEESRKDRYDLEKLELDIEKFSELVKNWNYHLRINEIDLNKAGLGE